MAREPDPTNRLLAQKRDPIQLTQANKPLPAEYRVLLFENKREAELVWNGNSEMVCDDGRLGTGGPLRTRSMRSTPQPSTIVANSATSRSTASATRRRITPDSCHAIPEELP